jgi:AcrR family transcriptional regulator
LHAIQGRASTAHADQVRQRILNGAARAFAFSGFQGTSVPDIAAEVGVSVGLLYRYFPSKAELFTAICISQMEAEMEALSQQLSGIANPRDRLQLGVDHYLRQLDREHAAGLVLGALAEAPTNPALREVMKLRRGAICGFIEGFIREGIEAGEVPPSVPVENFAEAMTMMLDGAVAAWAVSGPELDVAAMRDGVVSLLSAALQQPG